MRVWIFTIFGFICLAIGAWFGIRIWDNNPQDISTSNTLEVLMRNLNWGTNLESFTPYKKDDALEFVFITETNSGQSASIDISQLAEKLQITEILVNDIPTPLNKLQDILSDSALKITVRGKAKDTGITKE